MGDDSQDFGREFLRLWEQGFMRLWGRICEDSRDFGRGFARIRETLGEDPQGFTRLWEMISKDL